MSNHEGAVRAAKSPREALLYLARALDELENTRAADPWESWGDEPVTAADAMFEDLVEPDGTRTRHDVGKHPWTDPVRQWPKTDAAGQLVFPTVTDPGRLAARKQLAEQGLMLHSILDDVDPVYDWVAAYVTAGPLYLYHGNRELVMSYNEDVRRQMVADVELDDPVAAQEMSIDILKEAFEVPDVGAGDRALGVGEITGKRR